MKASEMLKQRFTGLSTPADMAVNIQASIPTLIALVEAVEEITVKDGWGYQVDAYPLEGLYRLDVSLSNIRKSLGV